MGFVGRRYAGIELLADPRAEDDLVTNRFTISCDYRVAQLAAPEGEHWIAPFEPWALRGVVNLPQTTRRQLPFVAAEYPALRQHEVVVEWPATVNVTRDATHTVVAGQVFRGESRSSFRGNRYEFITRIETTGPDVTAEQLAQHVADFEQFVATLHRRSVLRPGDLGAPAAQGGARAPGLPTPLARGPALAAIALGPAPQSRR